jgi:hypothetical protein
MSVEKNNHTADPRQEANESPRPDDSRQEQELGGPKGPEPTRYGDWEKKGRCIDF